MLYTAIYTILCTTIHAMPHTAITTMQHTAINGILDTFIYTMPHTAIQTMPHTAVYSLFQYRVTNHAILT